MNNKNNKFKFLIDSSTKFIHQEKEINQETFIILNETGKYEINVEYEPKVILKDSRVSCQFLAISLTLNEKEKYLIDLNL